MEHQPYIPGLKPAEAGPLSRFLPALEEGVIGRWLPGHAPAGAWLLDPFGFSPRLVLEAARAGYRVLATVNNPITRFLLELAANPPAETDFKAAIAELESSRKGDDRLGVHLGSLYLTLCESCGKEIQAESFLWRKGEDTPFACLYTCPHCGDSGEHKATEKDEELARKLASTDGLHRSRAFERVAALDDEDRIYAEEAIQYYQPRPLYALTTIINRINSLDLSPARSRALQALILVACDAGNTLWDHPPTRPRPKQLNIPNQFREFNLWKQLEGGVSLWTETGAGVICESWPNKIPESGGICIYDGRLKDLANEVKKQIPIAAVVGSIPRPNQAFWTLSALWAGWLWGREAVEPYKIALRRRRYDWAWNATALHAAFSHLFELLPLGTPCFGLVPEPEPPFLTSVITAGEAAGFDLKSVALRTEHDPVQLIWTRGEHLQREIKAPEAGIVHDAIVAYLKERGEPASYLHIHAAGLIALAEDHALKSRLVEFDDAMRTTNALIRSALSGDKGFVQYSSGESVDTGMWGLAARSNSTELSDSLADRVEMAIVTFLQKNPDSLYLEIEDDLYPRFPGLLTPSKRMIYEVLDSYADRRGAAWKLRPEDVALARRNELNTITAMLEIIGKRLNYSTRLEERLHLWETGDGKIEFVFYTLASALIGHALAATQPVSGQSIIVIPGGRAALIAYKQQRDPALALRAKAHRLVKYRLLRTMLEIPVLTRETFEEQIAGDPPEKSRSQMMMF